jgi:hypothetical protein
VHPQPANSLPTACPPTNCERLSNQASTLVHSSIRPFVHSSIRPFVHSSTRSFVHSSTRPLVHSYIRVEVRVEMKQHASVTCSRCRSCEHTPLGLGNKTIKFGNRWVLLILQLILSKSSSHQVSKSASQLPATCYLLPATCYLLPATCYLLPEQCPGQSRPPRPLPSTRVIPHPSLAVLSVLIVLIVLIVLSRLSSPARARCPYHARSPWSEWML